jgi:hypothetical protein
MKRFNLIISGDRTAIDSLMLVCGILAVVVNGFIAATASSIASD